MSDPFVAEIRMFGGNFAPTGWAQCDGQLLPISQNTALFSLLGTFYGGDGKSTFGLPNLGFLKSGMKADIVVFDAAAIRDEGTYAEPTRHPSGIDWVFVGGKAAVAGGKPTGVRNGQVLRHA